MNADPELRPEARGPMQATAVPAARICIKAPFDKPRQQRPNDLCKCGSKRKAKKCCLREALHNQAASLSLMQDYYNATGKLELPLPPAGVQPPAAGGEPKEVEARTVET